MDATTSTTRELPQPPTPRTQARNGAIHKIWPVISLIVMIVAGVVALDRLGLTALDPAIRIAVFNN